MLDAADASRPGEGATTTTDPAPYIQAALWVRDDVDRGDGVMWQTADELFARFGFVPSSLDEQRRIRDALTAAGIRVIPVDREGRQLRLVRTTSEVDAPLADTPAKHADISFASARLCERCQSLSGAQDRFCRECGAPLGAKPDIPSTRDVRAVPPHSSGRSTRAKWIGAATAVVILIGGGGAGAAVKIRHDHQAAQHRKTVAAQQARERAAAEARHQAAQAKAAADQVERSLRTELERSLTSAITKDARKNVAAGLLDGPITRTSCNPVGEGSDALSEPTGRYECIAVNKTNGDGTEEGYRYSATINYDEGSYTWHLGS